MAGGTIFQMDKATPESKIFLGHHDECSQDTSVLCRHNILSGCHCHLQIESQPSNLRNSTNFELFSTG